DPRSERELLSAAFPNFAASASSLNKWWSLQLATLSKPGIAEPYTPAESLKAIEEAITIRYEAPAADVPKNVKPRPFILPAPLPVLAAIESKQAPPPAPHAATPQTKKPAGVTEEPPTDEADKPKRSILRRLLFLGDPDPKEKETELKADEKPVAGAADEKGDQTEEEKKPGFIGRLFGAGHEDKKEPDKSKAAEIEKPRTAVKEEPEVKEEKKPSLLNPLNWFRGDKKPATDKEDEKADGEEQASAAPPETVGFARLLSPALADAWQWLSPDAAHPTKSPLLDFFKGKPKPQDEKEAEPAKKEEPKKAEAKPKAAVKDSGKPRTTNPNAKPASRPSPSSSGAPHTTNPNAKPVPAGMIKPATGDAASTAAVKSDRVPVFLPLEEYQHILKRPDRVAILNFNVASLRALELRVSILFRPVVTGYLAAVVDLQAGKTKDMDKRLATLHAFALVAYQKSVAVRDYLDWFEASESSRLSGKFDDYLNLPATIQKELPERTDPISKYLDAIDKEFSK
ncbi:MAG TPA: hypothetical protein PLB55_16000, partial [Prosthecobacter sp.]|nr:hypothetical protein [Prosthecobacter sp.]